MSDLEKMGGLRDEVKPGIFKDNAVRLLGLGHPALVRSSSPASRSPSR
jgi:hypothetical protein